MLKPTSVWESTFLKAHAGVLAMRNVSNPTNHAELEKSKAELEESLRSQFAGKDRAAIASHPFLKVYREYYKRFNSPLYGHIGFIVIF